MPNRIIKEAICTSESIDALTLEEEVFFYRLLVNCDDFGRMDGRTSVIKARLFPLREVGPEAIGRIIDRLEALQMVRRYCCGGKPYLQVVNWEAHQRIRCKRGKYPSPEEEDFGQESVREQQGDSPAVPDTEETASHKEENGPEAEMCPLEPQAREEDTAPQADGCGKPDGLPRKDGNKTHTSAVICQQADNIRPQSAVTCQRADDACCQPAADCVPNPIRIQSQSEKESQSESEAESGLLSAADAARWRDNLDAVQSQAARMGMAFAAVDRDRAESLMAEYSPAWLLEAMRRAAAGQASCRSWRYIAGILSAWRAKGGMDDVHGGSHRGGQEQGLCQAEGDVWAALSIRRY